MFICPWWLVPGDSDLWCLLYIHNIIHNKNFDYKKHFYMKHSLKNVQNLTKFSASVIIIFNKISADFLGWLAET